MRTRLATVLLLASLLGCDSKAPATSSSSSSSSTSSSSSETTVAPPPPARAADGTVTAKEGGRVGDDAGASVTVPPGGVKKDVRVEVTPVAADTRVAPSIRVVGRVWSFRADGKDTFSFSKRVRIAVPIDRSLMAADLPVVLSVWQKDAWKPVAGSRVEGSHAVADVNHFSDYAPTQDVTHTGAEIEAMRERFLKNEFWYAHVQIEIRGSGYIQESEGHSAYSISRSVGLDFRVTLPSGAHAPDAAMETMKKAGIKVPADMAAAYEEHRNKRTWMTDRSKREDETEHTVRVSDMHESLGTECSGEGGRVKDAAMRDIATASHADHAMGANTLEIDVARGTYKLTVGQIDTGTLELTHSVTRKPDVRSRPPHSVSVAIGPESLSTGGSNTITGIKRIPRESIDSTVRGLTSGFGYGTVEGLITWTLSPVPIEDVELVLKPDDYDTWLPRGGPDSQTVGNTIGIKAILRPRNGASMRARMRRLEVRFHDVSSEPGVCLNLPLDKGATTPDLKFSEESEGTVRNDGMLLQKEGEFIELHMKVECFDWGAWGMIKGWALLTDGRIIWSTLDGDPSEDELRLPKRKRNSKIADKWKKDLEVPGTARDEDDDDKQEKNQNYGDGLTVYEEYRGLIAKGKHTREHSAGADGVKPLTPKRKDLIIHNKFRDEAVIRKGLEMFAKASGIHVVEVDDGELPASRRVNVNAGRIQVTEQCGLLLEDASELGALGFTEQQKGARLAADPAASPKGNHRVTVSLEAEKDEYAKNEKYWARAGTRIPYTLEESTMTTVAHEVAHGVGVKHHGVGGSAFAGVTEVTSAMKDWSIYDRDGSLITTRPIKVSDESSYGKGTVGVGAPGNASSGDEHCIMCYVNTYTWAYHEWPRRTLYLVPVVRQGTIFCTSADATGYNKQFKLKDGKMCPGLFGQASKGNCLSQTCVRDPK